jgi:hypothetical protein
LPTAPLITLSGGENPHQTKRVGHSADLPNLGVMTLIPLLMREIHYLGNPSSKISVLFCPKQPVY